MGFEEKTSEISGELKCKNCGAVLHFAPGTHSLKCDYCSTVNEIEKIADAVILSYDYDTFIRENESAKNTREDTVVKCNSCGASTTLLPGVTADKCPFCASPLVIDHARTQRIQKPHYVLPFIVKRDKALQNFQQWMKGLWFAPSDLIHKVNDAASSTLQGIYIPHWSYDTDTVTQYRGKRGEYYYVTETYTETVNGKEERRTRQVRHTRWYPASGIVNHDFRDVLVSASPSLPQKTATTLEPWHLDQLVPFDERFLSGFRSETYQTDAVKALGIAKQKMDPVIRDIIGDDIGGDEQQIDHYENQYNNLALKYIVLPVWLSSYRYSGKVYQFVVNACTGEVVGERPWSVIKITLAVLLGLAIIALIIYFAGNAK
jgi:LSD1 subclass zinc finger protein